ncbi:MAG TPA: FmdB family zinc ribbon protein [Rhodothermales bacterium]|nr:FmdB family zinc ribbon protein [Rhodothermales bacterium]
MPTYVYRREDGTTFEIDQRITEDALTTCPTTGQPVTRVITGGQGLIFKGSGFYLTDYARSNGGTEGGKNASEGSSEKANTSSESTKSDTASPSTSTSKGDE